MTVRQVFSDIKGDKPKISKKKNKSNKIVPSIKQGVDWGKEDDINFDQRDRNQSTTA
jgi:hypothetical protein